MIIEVLPKDNCADCVFCSEMCYCNLRDGEPIDFDDNFGKADDSFCPLRNGDSVEMTDKVKVMEKKRYMTGRCDPLCQGCSLAKDTPLDFKDCEKCKKLFEDHPEQFKER